MTSALLESDYKEDEQKRIDVIHPDWSETERRDSLNDHILSSALLESDCKEGEQKRIDVIHLQAPAFCS